MENKAKILETSLANLLSNQEKIKELSNHGLLLEYKRLYLGVKYLNANNIAVANQSSFAALTSAINKNTPIDDAEFKLATSDAELAVLDNLNGALESLSFYGGESRKDRQNLKAREKEAIKVAGEILPDALNRAYDIILDHGQDGKIYDNEGNLIFDFESFIDKINKSAHKTLVVNNLPTLSDEAEKKYKKVVSENAREFLSLLPAIEKKIDELVINGVTKPVIIINTDIRKIRRDNRPVDKKGNLLPSYLDYITDDGKIVSYSEFLNSPTAKLLNEFSNEEEYKNYASSTAFWAYVSHLERPVSKASLEMGNPTFTLKIEGGEVKQFAKEKIVLPKNAYKLAKKSGNETTTISKVKNEKVLKALSRVVAGALSVVILAGSIGWSVKEIVESIKEHQTQNGSGNDNTPPVDGTTPPTDTPEQTTPNRDNVDIKDSPDEIVDNPAEEIAPPEEDSTTAPEETTSPEETTGPEETTTPEEITTPEEDPSKDNPESDVPNHNDIDEERREEETDDSFWFE